MQQRNNSACSRLRDIARDFAQYRNTIAHEKNPREHDASRVSFNPDKIFKDLLD
ncbi:hypothetical protein [Paraburkholderia bannensis]|uniref:hypothetical protein n=1 Tax=Paraburkholderia bannensis TaxID=765414 RepID=UPI002AB12106|nr:hypothetical protein [Paraburkholderia bannensis]